MTTGQHLDPRAIQGDSANDGYVFTTQGGVPVWAPNSADGVQSIIEGDNVDIDDTDPANPIISVTLLTLTPLTTTVGGDPVLVWDDNDGLVFAEVTL